MTLLKELYILLSVRGKGNCLFFIIQRILKVPPSLLFCYIVYIADMDDFINNFSAQLFQTIIGSLRALSLVRKTS